MHALHLLLSTNAPLQTHRMCLVNLGFFFGAARLPVEVTVLTRICEVLQTLVNPPELEYRDGDDASELEKRIAEQEKAEQDGSVVEGLQSRQLDVPALVPI